MTRLAYVADAFLVPEKRSGEIVSFHLKGQRILGGYKYSLTAHGDDKYRKVVDKLSPFVQRTESVMI